MCAQPQAISFCKEKESRGWEVASKENQASSTASRATPRAAITELSGRGWVCWLLVAAGSPAFTAPGLVPRKRAQGTKVPYPTQARGSWVSAEAVFLHVRHFWVEWKEERRSGRCTGLGALLQSWGCPVPSSTVGGGVGLLATWPALPPPPQASPLSLLSLILLLDADAEPEPHTSCSCPSSSCQPRRPRMSSCRVTWGPVGSWQGRRSRRPPRSSGRRVFWELSPPLFCSLASGSGTDRLFELPEPGHHGGPKPPGLPSASP